MFPCYTYNMGRPPKTDRAAVGSETLTLRLTPDLRQTLDALVAAKAAELEHEGFEVTAAAYVRGLIRREGRRLTPTIMVAAPVAATATKPTGERRQHQRPDDKQVRALFARVIAKGVEQKEIAALSGVSPSYISRWKGGKYGLSEETIGALSKALESLLQPSLPSVRR